VWFRQLPAGKYAIRVTLRGTDGDRGFVVLSFALLWRDETMRRVAHQCCVTAFAIALSACDGGTGVSVGPVSTAPSVPQVAASISRATAPQAPAFVGFGCFAHSQVSAAFDIVIVASIPIHLSQVTLRLIDGSNLGGPMVTFPQPALTAQFGTTDVLAGIPRTFTFRPEFQCGADRPQHVAAQLALMDLAGAAHGITVTAPWP
jgi:hypothetical protein